MAKKKKSEIQEADQAGQNGEFDINVSVAPQDDDVIDEIEDQSQSAQPVIDPKALKKQKKEEEKRLKKLEEEQKKAERKAAKDALKPTNAADSPTKPTNQNDRPLSRSANGTRATLTSRIFSPGVRPKEEMTCRVLLLDGSEFMTTVDKYAYGQHLVDKIGEYINLYEKDYFSCTFIGKRGILFWLMHERRIIKQCGEGPWDFKFWVKFYPREPTVLHEDITRYQLCLQVRNDIATGKLPCSYVTHALLGSYTAQSEFGDFEPTEHGQRNMEYVQDVMFAPTQTEDLLQKIVELHKTHMGQTPADSELNFLENAKKLQLYGTHIHPAKDSELVLIGIGVSALGIGVFKDTNLINHFPWPKILKMSYNKKKFYMKIRPAEFEQFENTIGFLMESHTNAKIFWRLATEHHTFFRLKEPRGPLSGFMGSFGSMRSRYSGRTLYQSQTLRVDRNQPDFDRSTSRRMTGSRSMDYATGASLAHYTGDMRNTKNMQMSPSKSLDGKQVSVLAGTGPDASRVAYVKTVRPDESEYREVEMDAAAAARYAQESAAYHQGQPQIEQPEKKKKKKEKSTDCDSALIPLLCVHG